MADYYLDSSAVVKNYLIEPGSTWVRSLINPAEGHVFYTVLLTGPEVVAAIFRKVRIGLLPIPDARSMANSFRANWSQQYAIVAADIPLMEQAMTLAAQYPLRGYDAVHLAAALQLRQERQVWQLPPLTFVSADVEQLRVAAALGLPTENPDQH